MYHQSVQSLCYEKAAIHERRCIINWCTIEFISIIPASSAHLQILTASMIQTVYPQSPSHHRSSLLSLSSSVHGTEPLPSCAITINITVYRGFRVTPIHVKGATCPPGKAGKIVFPWNLLGHVAEEITRHTNDMIFFFNIKWVADFHFLSIHKIIILSELSIAVWKGLMNKLQFCQNGVSDTGTFHELINRNRRKAESSTGIEHSVECVHSPPTWN